MYAHTHCLGSLAGIFFFFNKAFWEIGLAQVFTKRNQPNGIPKATGLAPRAPEVKPANLRRTEQDDASERAVLEAQLAQAGVRGRRCVCSWFSKFGK